jgi:hypothetical protein
MLAHTQDTEVRMDGLWQETASKHISPATNTLAKNWRTNFDNKLYVQLTG